MFTESAMSTPTPTLRLRAESLTGHANGTKTVNVSKKKWLKGIDEAMYAYLGYLALKISS